MFISNGWNMGKRGGGNNRLNNRTQYTTSIAGQVSMMHGQQDMEKIYAKVIMIRDLLRTHFHDIPGDRYAKQSKILKYLQRFQNSLSGIVFDDKKLHTFTQYTPAAHTVLRVLECRVLNKYFSDPERVKLIYKTTCDLYAALKPLLAPDASQED